MAVYCIEIHPRAPVNRTPDDPTLKGALHEAGLAEAEQAWIVRLFFLEGNLTRQEAGRIADELLVDPVTEQGLVREEGDQGELFEGACAAEVHLRPGVMDPVAESTLAELRAEGFAVEAVRTARRYVVVGASSNERLAEVVARGLANDCIEQVIPGPAPIRPGPRPPGYRFQLRTVPLRELDDDGLKSLARTGHLFLSLEEMRVIQAHFQELGRDPTDLELETLAQTWSEHCVHKTLKAEVTYRGAPLPGDPGKRERHYRNLLADTIAKATREIMAARRGPECLSVFKDNAGVIGFDDDFGVAFKVETHNHPSAIEPYGGAATGVGGCIRDVIGCGLGAKPIANTDVFCVAPGDWPAWALPKGVLHPRRVLRGVVRGVADYGNRMGIPTVNGAIVFEPRYLGNPLVFCGCVGLIPRDRIEKAARPGDLIVLVGGRTGRDGIHGATFSSAELTDTHADEFSHAVQIGNAITEKRFLDALLRARDDASGCLYHALTDCGAGGLSSAVGEMGEHVGACVDLDKVPLKYAGLRYDEIWISEAQERMVAAVPPDRLDRFMGLMAAEEVEATVIGTFGEHGPTGPRLRVRFEGHTVGELDMRFLHHGLPRRRLSAEWRPVVAGPQPEQHPEPERLLDALRQHLARPNVAAKEWVIRQYDHEVQGGSVVKPLVGPGQGPADAAVVRPRLESRRGVAIGCGLAPHLSDLDPYWMAVAAIDEALRNVVCVGGDPGQTAMLDNFCWGRADDPHQLGALVRACQACYDAAVAFGVPFISGKDSLNNEFALDPADVEPLLEAWRRLAEQGGPEALRWQTVLAAGADRLRRTRRLSIPGTLLISAISLVADVQRCVTPDLKQPGHVLVLLGGVPLMDFDLAEADRVHRLTAEALRAGLAVACHDVAEGGWLTAVAEMALAGMRGADLETPNASFPAPLAELNAAYVAETPDPEALGRLAKQAGVACRRLGVVSHGSALALAGQALDVSELRAAWAGK